MSEEELLWLASRAAEHSSIVEIGCFQGRSTCALAANTPGVVHAVDTWEGSQEGHWEKMAGKPPDWLADEFRRNTAAFPNVVMHRMPSLEAAAALSGLRFDMVFIDGAHGYDDVIADINACGALLTEGGLLCGHDYNDAQVSRAVNELVPDVGVVDVIWWRRNS